MLHVTDVRYLAHCQYMRGRKNNSKFNASTCGFYTRLCPGQTSFAVQMSNVGESDLNFNVSWSPGVYRAEDILNRIKYEVGLVYNKDNIYAASCRCSKAKQSWRYETHRSIFHLSTSSKNIELAG
jgi:hypothetical protein